MENQAYEEDRSRVEEEQSTPECRYRDQQHHAVTINGESCVARSTSHPENHVYEDISIGMENSSGLSKRMSFLESLTTCDVEDYRVTDLAKQVHVNGSTSIVSPVTNKSSAFQDNTSSCSSAISAYHDSASSSLRVVSRASAENNPEESFRDSPCDSSRPLSVDIADSALPSLHRENEDLSRHASVQSNRRPNRRRRKKDCKHCRNKLMNVTSCGKVDDLAGSKDAILKENQANHLQKDPDVSSFLFRESLLRSQNIKIYPIVNRTSLQDIGSKKCSSAPLCISDNNMHSSENVSRFLVNEHKMLDPMMDSDQNKMLKMLKNEADMRINSIYSQEHWYGKESPIFYTNVKDQIPFQRAYSLPARTHTPTSQNRVNLRRSVRNEPPPHPARLDKHRRGWTLHLARPLKASGCSSSLIPLLIILLILLGVAGVALYIVFEPEKLQIIQQYLKSSTGRLSRQNITSSESFTSALPNDEPNLAITMARAITTTMTRTTTTTVTTVKASADTFTMTALLNGGLSFPESTSALTGAEAEVLGQWPNANAIRYCDDCLDDEVCVALVDEEVPICRSPHDREDPTGCAGFCVINKQKCHRLDVDAFRCVEMEHYCLDDEWTCSNTLCIPLEKHCDGHMNCYDHSDEYNCVCNLETHFQCGNETSCLPLERRCDGKIDCWDATDEINCTLGHNLGWSCPLESEFTCSNGECILKVRFCDGLSDCSDGSDEPHGCQGRCNKHEFTCQNGRCITKGMKCNGLDDCGDGTDERHCKNRFT